MKQIKTVIYIFFIIFYGCHQGTPQKIKECKICQEKFQDLFVDYPIGKFRIGDWNGKGLVEEPRNIPLAKKRVDRDGNLRIVDEEVINTIYKYKFCFMGDDYDSVNNFFDKRISRELFKPDSKTLVLKMCFDFGEHIGNQSFWFDYECLSFKFKNENNKFLYKGSELDQKHHDNCGRDINFLEDRFKEKIKRREN